MKNNRLTAFEKNVVLALLGCPSFRRAAGLPGKGPLTLEQIAYYMQMSPQAIHGIEVRAKLKLKAAYLKKYGKELKLLKIEEEKSLNNLPD